MELLGGPPTKGIGFAIGTDRAILSLQESGNAAEAAGAGCVYRVDGREGVSARRWGIARKLRERGISRGIAGRGDEIRKALDLADKLGARYALIIGEDEVAAEQFTREALGGRRSRKNFTEERICWNICAICERSRIRTEG